ncbi:MAG: hypothetical protein GY803_03525 [Chloroflexi bacterium]|nr:hypothetical protein [Chloroflexota bacterium]
MEQTKLEQMELALHYLVSVLEEGSLVERYDKETRESFADVLRLLVDKVNDLPLNVPENLVQATAVRAIIDASEQANVAELAAGREKLARNQREVEALASIQGHVLGVWEQVKGSDMEFQATCQVCGGFVYVSDASVYNLLLDTCQRL